jgi:hypothetical protein
MRKAIFQFALSGKKSVLSTHVAELVEYGVASLDSGPDCDSLTNTHFLAKIDEPIIIQAGINFFGLRTTVTDNFVASSGPSHAGNLFERFTLSGIQKNFTGMVSSRVSENLLCGLKQADRETQLAIMKKVAVPQWSSYGVLAVDTSSDVTGTIKWIKDSLDARFEGTVVPFCYPDTLIGPDVLFFMRTPSYDYYLFVASQVKCKNSAAQLDSPRTVFPKFFYHQERKSGGQLNKHMTATDKEAWAAVEKQLFGMVEVESAAELPLRSSNKRGAEQSMPKPATKRTRAMVRFLVQYADVTKMGLLPGPVAFTSVQTDKECASSCGCEKHDLLITIDRHTAHELLGTDGAGILRLVKGAQG